MMFFISLFPLMINLGHAHFYSRSSDCVRAHPERPLSVREQRLGYATDVVCTQKKAPPSAIRIGCVGDSITAVGHTSATKFHWPNQLQAILDAQEGVGKYSVTNLGICGTTLSDHGAFPYDTSGGYKALVAGKWDIIFVMLGTNDARDTGSGGPEHWPRSTCDGATAANLDSCSFANNYTALLNTIKGLGRNASGPEVHIMIPPALMQQGAYAMNQTIINTIFPRLIPIIGEAHKPQVKSVIDVYTGMGGVPAPDWKKSLPPKCVLNSTWAPCHWYCDKQSCDECHPNDVGCGHLAKVVYEGCKDCWNA